MCNCNNHKVYVFSDMKIKRYMEVCGNCGTHIKWVSNSDWEKIKDTVIIMSDKEWRILKESKLCQER